MKIATRLSVLPSVLGIVALLCAQSAVGQQTSPEKPIISKMLVANVYPSGYSEIYLLDSPSGHRVVSTIDFTVFEPAVMIETADAIYDFFILCSRWTVQDVIQEQQSGNIGAKGFPNHWPLQLPSRAAAAHYLPVTGTAASGIEAQGERHLLDLLHRQYQTNRIQIEAQARQREIDQERATVAEAARLAALPSPEPLTPYASLFEPTASFFDGGGDGMSDVWQRIYGIEDSQGNDDPDGDGKTNAQESAAGTDPAESQSYFSADVVSDENGGLIIEWKSILAKRYQVEKSLDLTDPNGWTPFGSVITGNNEFISVTDLIVGSKAFYRVKIVPSLSSDSDLLDDWEESLLGTDPLSSDTDGDTLLDSDEFLNFTDPTSDDTDGDGIPDQVEQNQFFTNPRSRDSDGDGIDDLTETGYTGTAPQGVSQQQQQQTGGTNPLDPTDVFPLNPEKRQVKVRMFFRGTWPNYSGSPPPIPAINFAIGSAASINQTIVNTATATPGGTYFGSTNNTTDKPIDRGRSYPFTLTFAGNPPTWPTVVARAWGSPNNIAGDRVNLLINSPGKGYYISNDEGGVWSESAWQPTGNGSIVNVPEQQLEARNFASGTLWAVHFDLDIDSDDNNGIAAPPRTLAEEDIEETRAKIVLTNTNDDDNDSTPDFQDLSNAQELDLVPLVLEAAPNDLEWDRVKVKIRYNGSAAYNSGRVGDMRLWKTSSARIERSAGDYIEPNRIYSAAELGLGANTTQLKFFIEGLNAGTPTDVEAIFVFNDREYFHDKVLVQVKAERAEFVKHTPPNEFLYIATASRVNDLNRVEVTVDAKLSAQPSFNLGMVTSTRGSVDTISPNTGSTNAQGQFATKLKTRTLDGTEARIQFVGPDSAAVQSSPLQMQLPVKYESDFLVTFYTTYSESDPDFAGGPVVSETELRAGGVRQYYFITSDVPARQGFLRETALQGYGYLADGRLVLPQITPANRPNTFPAGTNANWRFLNARIVLAPAGTVPLGNAGNPLIDGSSAAIVRDRGGNGIVVPNRATFTIEGRPEVRTADDRVTADKGIYHIDLYRIAPRATIQVGTFSNGRVTLQTQ